MGRIGIERRRRSVTCGDRGDSWHKTSECHDRSPINDERTGEQDAWKQGFYRSGADAQRSHTSIAHVSKEHSQRSLAMSETAPSENTSQESKKAKMSVPQSPDEDWPEGMYGE